MDEADGRKLKADIIREEVTDQVWEQLIEYADPVFKAIKAFFYQYTHVYDHPESEDVLNTTFAKVVVNFDKYSADRPLLPWIKRIAHNEVVNALRSRGCEVQLDSLRLSKPQLVQDHGGDRESDQTAEIDSNIDAIIDQPPNFANYVYDYGEQSSKLASTVRSKIFREELELLSDAEQTLIIEHYSNGITLADLADREGVSPDAMRQRALRTRRKLFARLVRHPEFTGLRGIKLSEAPLRR